MTRVQPPAGAMMRIHIFATAFRLALGSTQPPIQWVPGALTLRVKWLRHEANHSPPSSGEVKDVCCCSSTPQYIFKAWCLVKHRDLYNIGYLSELNEFFYLAIFFIYLWVGTSYQNLCNIIFKSMNIIHYVY
jgi:hypothetical protein